MLWASGRCLDQPFRLSVCQACERSSLCWLPSKLAFSFRPSQLFQFWRPSAFAPTFLSLPLNSPSPTCSAVPLGPQSLCLVVPVGGKFGADRGWLNKSLGSWGSLAFQAVRGLSCFLLWRCCGLGTHDQQDQVLLKYLGQPGTSLTSLPGSPTHALLVDGQWSVLLLPQAIGGTAVSVQISNHEGTTLLGLIATGKFLHHSSDMGGGWHSLSSTLRLARRPAATSHLTLGWSWCTSGT